jgi:nucleotide-binding universal stress UspA family protein
MYTRILVPLDGSETAECVLPYVKWYTQVSDLNELVFLRAVEPFQVAGALEAVIITEEREHIEEDAVSLAQKYLDKVAADYRSDNFQTSTVVKVGKPAKVVEEYADKNEVDLVIMATHGFSGVQRIFRGSVADEVLRTARVPVLLVTPRDRPPDK